MHNNHVNMSRCSWAWLLSGPGGSGEALGASVGRAKRHSGQLARDFSQGRMHSSPATATTAATATETKNKVERDERRRKVAASDAPTVACLTAGRRVYACALTEEVVARQLDRRRTELVILAAHAAGKRTLCEQINKQGAEGTTTRAGAEREREACEDASLQPDTLDHSRPARGKMRERTSCEQRNSGRLLSRGGCSARLVGQGCLQRRSVRLRNHNTRDNLSDSARKMAEQTMSMWPQRTRDQASKAKSACSLESLRPGCSV